MTVSLSDLTDQLLDAAKTAGAEAADAMVVSEQDVQISVRSGALEQAERSEGVNMGLRVLMGQRQACVSISDMRAEALTEMAERAVAMAREAPEDPHIGLAPTDMLTTSWETDALALCDHDPAPTPEELQDMALRAESTALAVEGIAQVSDTSAGYGKRDIHLATSNGFSGGYSRTTTSLGVVAITGSGIAMQRDYAGDARTHRADLDDPEEIATLAAERTLARREAQKPPTGTYPVLFDERVSSSLLGHFLGAINGSSVARGGTFLRAAMGELVFPKSMEIYEDPSLPRMFGSKPFDAEGLPASELKLIEDGVLKSWVLDLATARKLGLESTGNAARGPSAPPSPSVGNIRMTQGDKSRDELLKEMGTGLLVTSMIGSTINPTTGDYSRGAIGHWVENGEITYAVHECTIAGNLREMFRTLTPANDARMYLSRAVPSLLVEGLTLAGS